MRRTWYVLLPCTNWEILSSVFINLKQTKYHNKSHKQGVAGELATAIHCKHVMTPAHVCLSPLYKYWNTLFCIHKS